MIPSVPDDCRQHDLKHLRDWPACMLGHIPVVSVSLEVLKRTPPTSRRNGTWSGRSVSSVMIREWDDHKMQDMAQLELIMWENTC